MSKIKQLNEQNTTWCFPSEHTDSFDKRLFDAEWARRQGYLAGTPAAGRGNTHFLNVAGVRLVLREYRRGGMIRHFNSRHYLWQGLPRTRAFRELTILNSCAAKGLSAPQAYACKVERNALVYRAALITYKLNGSTLAEALVGGKLAAQAWQMIGQTIATFHQAGIWHADLNAHNILVAGDHLDDAVKVSLIDFDRAREIPANSPAMQSNIVRLHRSLLKEAGKAGYEFDAQGWGVMKQSYQASLG